MSTAPARVAPSTEKYSSWIWIASGVIVAVIAIMTAFQPVDLSMLPESERPYAGVVPISGAVGGVIAGLLHVLFAVFLLRGRNWARIVLTVIGALSLIGLVVSTVQGSWLSAIGAVVTIVAGVLMWLPSANAYFRRR